MLLFKSKIFSNSMWMIFEKFIGAFGIIFINAYMAKYIGPENFGRLAFSTSLFFFVQTFSWFGAQNILFKTFSKNFKSGIALSMHTQYFRRTVFVFSSFLCLLYLWLYADFLTFFFGIANCLAAYYLVLDFYSIYNNATLKSSINALTNIFGLFLGFLTRYLLVLFEASIYTMAIPIVIISAVPFLIRKYYFLSKHNIYIDSSKRRKYTNYIYKTGGALVLSTLSIVAYTQISNIFIANELSFYDLGIYNVAMTLGASWGFVNAALITSFFSKIYSEKSYDVEINYLRKITWLVVFMGFTVLLLSLILSEWFVGIFFGKDFLKAAELIPIIVIGATFSGLSTITYRYMIKLNAYKYLSIKMIILSLLSAVLSYGFIKAWGIYGASMCFVIVELLAFTVSNYFYNNGFIFKQHKKIFNLFHLLKIF